MQLIDIEISSVPEALPDAVTDFLDEAQARVSRFVDEHALLPTGFVPASYTHLTLPTTYAVYILVVAVSLKTKHK